MDDTITLVKAEYEALIKNCNFALDRMVSLYDAIAYGSDTHKAWLKDAIADHFAGRAVSPPVE